ncbi:MAG TPA: lipopolysaccharide heptosyltransferase I [Nitrospirae bacterium]|nr:lipopolysaccharide heptosyltransferase I [Nitrospirota bacterium]HDZ02280.1 lipopolysaccharide heptosyltransferase I [Nitrospirota bacterium]
MSGKNRQGKNNIVMKILIIKPSSLGDVIHALPFLNAVKESFPEARIDWVISKNLKGILEDNPLINELIIFNKDAWKSLKNLPETLSDISSLRKNLQSKRYDMVVDLQGLLRSGLIAFSAPGTLKIGFADSREGSRVFYDKKVSANSASHAVDRCLEVAKEIGARVNNVVFPLHIDNAASLKIKKLLGDIDEYIVIAPSARWLTKRWPAERFASLIKKVSAPCVITGSKGDIKRAQKIMGDRMQSREHRDKVINICGKTGLKELAALIAGAKAVVSNDSGPMHIAAALDIPTVAIFGPTDPLKTGPYGWQTNRRLRVIKADIPCSPCRKKKCDEFICMENISVEMVFEALNEYL